MPTNTCYTWDLLAGAWYSSTGAAAGAGKLVTVAGLLADFGAGVRLMDGATNSGLFGTTGGTVHLQDGFNGNYDLTGYMDAYTLGTGQGFVTYDFEPAGSATVPLPSSALMGLGLLGGLGGLAWRKRRRATP